MLPIVGLIPLVDEGRKSLWMLPDYMEGLAAAGALPVMLPLEDDEEKLAQLLEMCDGLLLTGGHDVSPEVYGEERLDVCGACAPARDRMEAPLLRMAIAADAPVLGICRGIQFINAALGGTLWQDLPRQHPSSVTHRQSIPYDRPIHEVEVLPDTPLAELLGVGKRGVNSYHHQAVRELSPQLRPMAMSTDGLVEAAWRPESRFLWAVQWHPECAWRFDPAALAVFERFVEACRVRQAERGAR